MKKTITLLLAFAMLLSLAACGAEKPAVQATESTISVSEKPSADKPSGDSEIPTSPNQDTDTTQPEETADPVYNTVAETEASEGPADGIRPEFQAAMDAYEGFYDEYCGFMAEYKENPSDITLLLKYSNMMTKAVEVDESFKKWDDGDLNSEELKYYLEVNNRVMQKMLGIMG